jgi:hypothetical protein
MLAVPSGGRVEAAPAQAGRLERVTTVVCYEGRGGAEIAGPLRGSLEGAGWGSVVVERHPALAGRWSVHGTVAGLALAGVIEEGQSGCGGARLSLGAQVVPDQVGRRTAGARSGRLPNSP